MSFSQLVSNLKNVNIYQYQKLFKYEAFLKMYSGLEWKQYINFSNQNYQRELMYRDLDFEIYTISWPSIVESKIHNHANYGCLMKVMQGKIDEKLYTPTLDLKKTNKLKTNQISYIDDSIGYHSISNPYTNNAVSLHIYSPPLHKTEYF